MFPCDLHCTVALRVCFAFVESDVSCPVQVNQYPEGAARILEL